MILLCAPAGVPICCWDRRWWAAGRWRASLQVLSVLVHGCLGCAGVGLVWLVGGDGAGLLGGYGPAASWARVVRRRLRVRGGRPAAARRALSCWRAW